MPVTISIDQIVQLAPHLHADYRAAFRAGQSALDLYRVSDSALRVAHFMAQVLHESTALTVQYENLNYSAERLAAVWPRRFRPLGPLEPAAYAHDPQRLANAVYGGRMGNRGPDDGYTFRGRGLLQLTGKSSYAYATAALREVIPAAPDFTRAPDAVLAPAWCLDVAAAQWVAKGCNELADRDDLQQITRRINGGLTGLAQRQQWAHGTKAIWH